MLNAIAFLLRENSSDPMAGVFLFITRESVVRDLLNRLSKGGPKGRVPLPSAPVYMPGPIWANWRAMLPNPTIILNTLDRHSVALCDPKILPPPPIESILVHDAYAGGVDEGYFYLQCFAGGESVRSSPLDVITILYALWYMVSEDDLPDFLRLIVVAKPEFALRLLRGDLSVAAPLPLRPLPRLEHDHLLPLLHHENRSIREETITALGSLDHLSETQKSFSYLVAQVLGNRES